MSFKIAILVPCYNEALTIAKVVRDFKACMPDAVVYVYDNNSRDETAKIAREAGAVVRSEKRQGKGWVVRSMFAEIDADYYVMVDGDATYEAQTCVQALELFRAERLDVLNIAREQNEKAYRMGHQLGNRLFNKIVKSLFGNGFDDMLSGYKIFSRRFVKSFPALSPGFEVETELTIFALAQGMKMFEVSAPYHERPEGSFSKLSTYKDGFKVLKMIVKLLRYEKPFLLFGGIAVILALLSILLGVPVILAYMQTHLVLRFPTAILSMGVMIVAIISFFSGLILDNITRSKHELQRITYLNIPVDIPS